MKVLQLIYQDPAYHPVVRFSCQLFAERGADVVLIARTPNQKEAIACPDDFGEGAVVETIGDGRQGLGDKIDFAKYIRRVRNVIRSQRPDVVVAYNFMAAAAAWIGGGANSKIIYHNLDYVEKHEVGTIAKYLVGLEEKVCRAAEYVTASSLGRAERLQVRSGLDYTPGVFKNCQRSKLDYQPTGQLRRLLEEHQIKGERIVLRLGLIGRSNAIEATLRSVPHWDDDGMFVLAGVDNKGFSETVSKIIEECGIERRVLPLYNVPYDLWYDCLFSAYVGSALYQPGDFSNQTMAGAGNKLNTYLKVGLPCICPDIPDFVEFNNKYNAAIVADHDNPQDIARAINTLLRDPEKRQELAANATRAFDEEFNFEVQYQPTLDKLQF